MDLSARALRGALAVLALAGSLAGCGQATTSRPVATTTTPLPGQPPAVVLPSSDVELMMHAARDSMAEVRLGQLAQQRASTDVVRQLAQRLVTDHSQADAELLVLVQRRGMTIPATLDPQQQAVAQRLAALSGTQFDVAYLEQVIAGHARAIAMYERAAATATDPALRAWAARQLGPLRQHQAMVLGLHSQIVRTPPVVHPNASPVIIPR